MSITDDIPRITLQVPEGKYAVYVAGCNLGVDQLALGEVTALTVDQLASRRDLEWYRIFIVPGTPSRVGRIKDEGSL